MGIANQRMPRMMNEQYEKILDVFVQMLPKTLDDSTRQLILDNIQADTMLSVIFKTAAEAGYQVGTLEERMSGTKDIIEEAMKNRKDGDNVLVICKEEEDE